MSVSTYLILLIAGLPAITSCDGAGSNDAVTRTLEEQVDEYMSAYVDLAFFDGVILVARGGEVLLGKGYGMADYNSGRPNRTDTRLRVASIAKPFTELAIGRLIEDGSFSRDTPISTWFGDFPRGDDITVGHLVDNTSGVAHTNSLPWYDQFDRNDWSLDELVDRLTDEPLNFDPGAQFAYTNGGYVLMAAIIEAESGQPYGDFLRSEVFQPLGMMDSGHERHEANISELAIGHYPGTESLDARIPAPYVEMSIKIGGGSVYSTAEDLLAFANALFSDQLVSEQTWQMLFPTSGGRIDFSGRQPGFNAWLHKDLDEDITVIVLANNYGFGMMQQATEAIARMVRGTSYEPPLISERYATDISYLESFAGIYDVPDGSTVELEVRDGQLGVVGDGEVQELLVPVRENVFLLRITYAEVVFEAAPGGGDITGAEVTLLVDDTRIPITKR